ncbi:MAG TPA: M13 family metallopeptidase [Kofleriaceae bacterium]|jgi:endothelin-converting enzyme/putative endopeptidase|nr:M13 family metallopeptidase [Kofleriaceae bacterium]
MRRLILVLLAACGPHPATPTPGRQTGIYTEDLDRSADACSDFYQFANGSWRAAHPIPASQPRWSRRWESGERAKEQLHAILDEVSARTDWPAHGVEQLIGDFYGACMDEARADRLGIEPLRPLLADIAAIRDRAGLQRVIVELNQLLVRVPFAVLADSDLHEPTEIVAVVASSGLGLPERDYYLGTEPRFTEARDRYRAHVAAMFALAGRTDGAARARTVLDFETRLARATLENVEARKPENLDHRMTIAGLGTLAPSFDWAGYFSAIGVPGAPLNVTEPAFMQQVERELAGTPIADWQVYLEWHVLASAAQWLSRGFVDEAFAFDDQYLSGLAEQPPRWKRCVELTDRLLGEALGQKYVERHFPPAAKARVLEMVDDLLAAMHESIDGLDWMSPATRRRALDKLATFRPKVGYPDRWKDYRSVTVRRDALWDDVAAARRWNFADDLGQIGKPLDRGRWGMTPPTSDAYYSSSLNQIVFPAGILQPPGFRIDAVDAVNYGSIGVVIGHEISHGFDDQGAKFDGQGRLSKWWTPDDLQRFVERGRCVVDQFDGYFVEPGVHTNGELVLGESIGDLGGVNLAYRAFQRARRRHPAPTLDGFTPDQQFFIAWGQWRGDAVRPEEARQMVQADPHPIGKYRVIGPLSNMPEFAHAFACPARAPMVRDPVCKIW